MLAISQPAYPEALGRAGYDAIPLGHRLTILGTVTTQCRRRDSSTTL